MRPRDRTVERVMARIATGGHGVVSRRQLLAADVTTGELKHALATGLLIREYRGVYRVGHRAPSVEATYLAAVRACGEGSLLERRAAGHLLSLLRTAPPRPEVITATERRVPGIVTRRARSVDPRDAIVHRGIPVTSVPRTLVDLAAVLPSAALARAGHEADVRYRLDPAAVDAVLERRPSSPGARRLRAVLHGDIPVTLSALEARFLAVLAAADLPLPQTNRVASGRRVDCRWPKQRLTVELDSYRFHRSRHAWEQDRLRERAARKRLDEFRRYTYADVFEDTRFMLAELRVLLLGNRPGLGSLYDP